MQDMFNNANAFNQTLTVDVSSVTNIRSMFNGATAFNGNISSWNTSSVTNMSSIFSNARAFNQNIKLEYFKCY